MKIKFMNGCKNAERGGALLVVMIVLLAMTMTVLTSMDTSLIETQISGNMKQKDTTFFGTGYGLRISQQTLTLLQLDTGYYPTIAPDNQCNARVVKNRLLVDGSLSLDPVPAGLDDYYVVTCGVDVPDTDNERDPKYGKYWNNFVPAGTAGKTYAKLGDGNLPPDPLGQPTSDAYASKISVIQKFRVDPVTQFPEPEDRVELLIQEGNTLETQKQGDFVSPFLPYRIIVRVEGPRNSASIVEGDILILSPAREK